MGRPRAALALLLASCAACGARQSFCGTYVGPVEARLGDGGTTSQTRVETWVITSPDDSWPAKTHYHVAISRGGAAVCELDGIKAAGYELQLNAGQTCTRDGVVARLDEGSVHGTQDVEVTLAWTTASGATLAEKGELKRQR